jgi:hypothetical protein
MSHTNRLLRYLPVLTLLVACSATPTAGTPDGGALPPDGAPPPDGTRPPDGALPIQDGSPAPGSDAGPPSDAAPHVPDGETPFSGTPAAIPGTIQAEDFDQGGEGVAYHDVEAANKCNATYRPGEGVDLKTCTDTGGGYAIGWTEAGEWVQYLVHVTATDTYTVEARVASAESGQSLQVELDGISISGTLAVPVTGAWDTAWATVAKNHVDLTQGPHVLRVVFDTGVVDLNYLKFTRGAVDPCANVTCSGHGTCTAPGGTATCACDEGYHQSGTECLADGVTGAFSVSGGQIIGPDGATFRARGLNAPWWAPGGLPLSQSVWDSTTGAPLTTAFPGINFVRAPVFSDALGNATPAAFQEVVSCLSSRGIVVEFEYHNYPAVVSGSPLTAVASWYASMAAAFRDNPYVWFGTQNEPDAGDPSGVLNEIVTIYDAVRGTGSEAIVMVCPGGGYTFSGFPASTFAAMRNIVWDVHYYNWISGYSADLQTNINALADEVHSGDSITSADGAIPTIIGEFGDSTTGSSVDGGWSQVLQAVYRNPWSGYAQWYWNWGDASVTGGGADMLIAAPYDGTNLTAGGQMLRDAIQSGL